jgi:hypothetical protein
MFLLLLCKYICGLSIDTLLNYKIPEMFIETTIVQI